MKAQFSGQFYPENPEEMLKNFKESKKSFNAAIAPHAGYIFSGALAMLSVSSVFKDAETILIFAPSHTGLGDGLLYEPYEVPNGTVEGNEEIGKKFEINVEKNYIAFLHEHAVEVQMPIIAYLNKKYNRNVKHVSFIVQDLDYVGIMEKAIKMMENEKIGILISSDFIHHGPSYGFMMCKSMKEFWDLNNKILDTILKIQPEEFLQNAYTVCGKYPIFAFLKAIKNLGIKVKAEVLAKSDSSKIFPSADVVAYASIGFKFL